MSYIIKMAETSRSQRPRRSPEKKLSGKIFEQLKKDFEPQYEVREGADLLYKLSVGPDGKLRPDHYESPTRGQFAFQTDISIWKKHNGKAIIPLVVVELKSGGFSTHDLLTYSTKALRHKEIYPYLRYGFVVGGKGMINGKFFTHHAGFDFALIFKNYQTDHRTLTNLIKRQIDVSRELCKLMNIDVGRKTLYETGLHLK